VSAADDLLRRHERSVDLAGVQHVAGRCCQELKCTTCGAPSHEQGRPESSCVETACERCHADLFR